VDIGELDNLIDLHLDTNADYSRSLMSLPRGVGSEIFSFAALEKSYLYGKKDNHKEHVNEYIEEHESKFNISNLSVIGIKKSPEVSLTVDTKSDYEKACFIVEQSNNEYVTTEEAVELCLQYA
jgi:spore coat polysaccharide biosynthesis protein SpsF